MKKNVIFIAYLVIVFIVGLVISSMGYDMFTLQYWFLCFSVILSYCLGRLYEYYSYDEDEDADPDSEEE